MEISLQFILAACIVYFGLTFIQSYKEIDDQFLDRLNSLPKYKPKENVISFKTVKNELSKEQKVFDTMRRELQTAQYRNAYRKKNPFEYSKTNEYNIIELSKREANKKGQNSAVGRESDVKMETNAAVKPSTAAENTTDSEKSKLVLALQSNGSTENRDRPLRSQLKTPKGTRNYGMGQMALRNKVMNDVITVFKRHGAGTIDTPLMELREVLTDNWSEDDNKLIYDLADQGGELLSLRYDLTVPFARYLAMNKITKLKRYQVGKVYRRDNPAKGRHREFFQCDFDIAGKHDTMLPEVTCVRVAYDILNELNIISFRIKVNHRAILDGLFEACRIDQSKFRTICTSIDKLDKEPWEVVRKEMLEKGLSGDEADKIGGYMERFGGPDMVEALLGDEFLASSNSSRRGLEDVRLFLRYCDIYGMSEKISFDLSLARGLDYYTGLIYEIVLETSGTDESIGSVAAGGRYDNLVGMFAGGKMSVPCVGISIGFERLFSVIEARNTSMRAVETEVFVASAQKNMREERMKIVHELLNNRIKADHSFDENPKLLQQLHYCEEERIPYAVIIGESELRKGVVKIRDVQTRGETEIVRAKLIPELKSKLLRRCVECTRLLP